MAEYLVEWKIDIDADNPADAAKQQDAFILILSQQPLCFR